MMMMIDDHDDRDDNDDHDFGKTSLIIALAGHLDLDHQDHLDQPDNNDHDNISSLR